MRDAGLQERPAFRREAVPGIEPDGMRLRVQNDLRHASFASRFDQMLQQAAADLPPAPLAQHRHATHVPIGQKTAGPDRLAGSRLGENMLADGVELVPLQLERDLLLDDEHGLAHLAQRSLVALPLCTPHAKCIQGPVTESEEVTDYNDVLRTASPHAITLE